jgi:hypothetical protein
MIRRTTKPRGEPSDLELMLYAEAVRVYLLASGWTRALRRRRPPLTGREESWAHQRLHKKPTDTETALSIQRALDEIL